MQLLLLLSAIMAALTGVSGRAVVTPQIERASNVGVEAIAVAPVAVTLAIATIMFAIALRTLPLPRPLTIARTIALYLECRRE